MSDPWGVCTTTNNSKKIDSDKIKQESEEKISQKFEDNFVINTSALPDSEQYLKSLEKKLSKIKRDSNILKQLSDKKEECLRNLLNDSLNIKTETELELDESLTQGDSTVQEIYRHICPVQPLNTGEIVHIVKYDQLQEQYHQINENDQPENQDI